ncbi:MULTISPECIES: amidohydrolase family protein [unclassified Chelatococcus]|uniref:amidohydrolase family protein n=1 Tax=unclassified Chelatococcus TaxID=2638111 RepID=UPI001BCEDDC9|nr:MULTISPECIES: amidohydrolase family protein [unclassified Chelatococcus]CAH1672211.1 Imidazolonepropionase-like amidohydrolase [Hyphomicrobiales bacterium]MBS7738977.1 amidohydrolase family protein [Chelatococcus sp. HY11]MBX3543410.1 amidohydrolase family protein [Chelatococcus sp.]MCO5076493.1 amidohydrolase family protein [Chelatococcus sp.]CAH1675568.1 Imidazolonepropionase-like amidohydrolase [Hyphomicrobiales bacterium]
MTDSFWIRADHLWSDHEGRFTPGLLRIEGGRITARAEAPDTPPAGARVIDMGRRYVLPGLINTHVHLEFSASAKPLDEFYAENDEERLMRAMGNAHRMLLSGVTTIRDCGSSWSMLALARRPDLAPVPLPTILCSGPPMTVPAGHLHFMHGIVESDAEILAHIDRIEADGGRSVKVMASGGAMTPGSDPVQTVFSQDKLDLIASEARRRKLPSVSHVLSTESIKRSAQAHMDSLEHCAFYERDADGMMVRRYDSDVAAVVRDSGSAMMANLSTATRSLDAVRSRGAATVQEAHALRQFDVMVENFGRFVTLGVPMVCGNDAGVRDTPFEDTWMEISWLQRGGLSAVQSIRAATSQAAKTLLIDQEVGQLEASLSADLIALETNPLDDSEAFREVIFVMKAGKVIADRI